MLSANLVIFVCLGYVVLLFAVAFMGDAHARNNPHGWLSSPLVYTLSISIYCTSWTFFGAVGSAVRNGLEFVTIYLGPTIVFVGWWVFLRKLVTVGRVHHTTSIADLISARFGKNPALGAIVTILALVATAPYIALQLKALTGSFQVITFPAGAVVAANLSLKPDYGVAFWVAAGLCLFSIMFGVRNIDVNERHHGVIAAIAVEAVVKLVALVAVGLWVIYGLAGTPAAAFANPPPSLLHADEQFGARWASLLFLAGAAVVCLPRQFQVTVVENSSDRQIRTASWLFPTYLFLISLFVMPVAITGMNILPSGSDPDLYVLTLPLGQGENALGLLAFLGGFSSATSMVIVSSIALSTMISNHIVMPLALRFSILPAGGANAMRGFILTARRLSIVFIISLGFVYFWLSGTSDALAAIGLISFCGVAQFLPGLVGGLCWRRATHQGAIAGLLAGAALWFYTLFLPSLEGFALMPLSVIEAGPFGIAWLKPQALFGISGPDPLVHALLWSITVNVALFIGVSMLSEPSPLARVQSTLFVDVFRQQTENELSVFRRTARVADLRQIADRILGPADAMALFSQGADGERSVLAGDDLISLVERRLAAHVGAATARSLVSQVVTSETIGVEELKRLAGEAEQIRAYSAELERKSLEFQVMATELGAANERLRAIDTQKDEFLSQVSHELRTPMAAIRSFSDILLDNRELAEEKKLRFLGIIQNESLRLTRLLDEILDMQQLEAGGRSFELMPIDPERALDEALESCEALAHYAGVKLKRGPRIRKVRVTGNHDKLAQVFVNLIANAIKYNDSRRPEVVAASQMRDGAYEALISDNGPGIALADRDRIFQKFTRGAHTTQVGAGLGLAISQKMVANFGGDLLLDSGQRKGAQFIVRLKPAPAVSPRRRQPG